MSSTKSDRVQTVEEMLESLGTGDKETFLDLQTTNVNWEVNGNSAFISPNTTIDTQLIPFAGSWFGREGISRSVGDFFDATHESIEILDFEPLDLLQEGDRVVARVNLEAIVEETGLPFEVDMSYVVDFEDEGNQIESVEVINNSFIIAEAFAGQTPSPEAVEINAINDLKGVPLSVNPDADSEETLQVLESAYQQLAQLNLEGFAQAFAEDAIFLLDGDPNATPVVSRREGPQGVIDFFTTTLEVLDTKVINIDEIIANGDRAVVIMDVLQEARETNLPAPFTLVHSITVQNGLITDVQAIVDTYSPVSALAGEPPFLPDDQFEVEPFIPSSNLDSEEILSEEMLNEEEMMTDSTFFVIEPIEENDGNFFGFIEFKNSSLVDEASLNVPNDVVSGRMIFIPPPSNPGAEISWFLGPDETGEFQSNVVDGGINGIFDAETNTIDIEFDLTRSDGERAILGADSDLIEVLDPQGMTLADFAFDGIMRDAMTFESEM